MWVLGIETAGNVGGVALWREGEVPYELRFPARMCHAELLAPAVEGLFAQSRVKKRDLGLIAVDIGPGSFTGVRIGISFAKALAQSLGIPLVGVRQSEALGIPVGSWCPRVAVLIHDRRDLVYFCWAEGAKAGKEETLPLSQAIGRIPPRQGICVVGSGAVRFRERIEKATPGVYILGEPWAHPLPGVVAQLGLERYRSGESGDPKELEPNYVQPPLAKEGHYGKGL